jgi:hypothetical protein
LIRGPDIAKCQCKGAKRLGQRHARAKLDHSIVRIVAATSMYFQYCISSIISLPQRCCGINIQLELAPMSTYLISVILSFAAAISARSSSSTYAHFGAESVAFYAPQCTEVNLKKIQVTNTIPWVHFAFEITETSKSKQPPLERHCFKKNIKLSFL